MAIFGALKRKPMFGQIPGMMQPEMQPDTFGEAGAMQPNMQAMTKKPGFFGQGQPGRHIAGFIGDALQQIGGGQPTYMPNLMETRQQDAMIRARMEAEQRQRMASREDKQWEWQNKPKDTNPYRWEANDGSLMEIGPDGQPRQVYKDPTPKVNYQRVDNGDGTFQLVPIVNGQIMTGQTPTAPVGKLRPIGGGVGDGTGRFPR